MTDIIDTEEITTLIDELLENNPETLHSMKAKAIKDIIQLNKAGVNAWLMCEPDKIAKAMANLHLILCILQTDKATFDEKIEMSAAGIKILLEVFTMEAMIFTEKLYEATFCDKTESIDELLNNWRINQKDNQREQ